MLVSHIVTEHVFFPSMSPSNLCISGGMSKKRGRYVESKLLYKLQSYDILGACSKVNVASRIIDRIASHYLDCYQVSK